MAEAKRGRYKTVYDIMKLTVNPGAGNAVKELFFTSKGEDLYAIMPVYPDNEILIKDVKLKKDGKVTLLGLSGELDWKRKGYPMLKCLPLNILMHHVNMLVPLK